MLCKDVPGPPGRREEVSPDPKSGGSVCPWERLSLLTPTLSSLHRGRLGMKGAAEAVSEEPGLMARGPEGPLGGSSGGHQVQRGAGSSSVGWERAGPEEAGGPVRGGELLPQVHPTVCLPEDMAVSAWPACVWREHYVQ